MYLDQLTISVLFGSGTGVQHAEIRGILDSFPQLKVLDQSSDPQSFVSHHQEVAPDVVLVEMNGDSRVPEWLENLTQELPQTQVLVCSVNREPDFLIRAMQVGIREFLPLPLTKPELEAALNRVSMARRRLQPVDNRKGSIIVVTGHKGGVGTTTVAVNLADGLAELAMERVALVDLGRPFPDVANFLDQESKYSIADLIQNISNLDQSFIQRIIQPYGKKMAILHGCSDFRDQENIDLEILERILALLRYMYRFIVIDLSHWLDELFLKVVSEADRVVMLTGLTIPDIRNLKKLWPYLMDWHQDRRKIKIVVNRYDNSKDLYLRDLEQIMQHDSFHTLPSDTATLMQCLNQGTPLMAAASRSKLCRAIKEMAGILLKDMGVEDPDADYATRKKFWLF